jgi:hypothetical protein
MAANAPKMPPLYGFIPERDFDVVDFIVIECSDKVEPERPMIPATATQGSHLWIAGRSGE